MLSPRPAKQAAARAYNAFNLATFTIGTKNTNTINVAVQLKDARAQSPIGACHARVFLSDAVTGLGITGTGTTSALAIGTNGYILSTPVSAKMVEVETDALGRFDLNVIQTVGSTTYYMVIEAPDGSIIVSGAITF